MSEKKFTIDEPQTIRINNTNRLDLGAAAAMSFFGRCFAWFDAARLENKKIRIVIEHNPTDGTTVATFAKADSPDFAEELRDCSANRHKINFA